MGLWARPCDHTSGQVLLGAGSRGWGASSPHAPICQSITLMIEKDICWGQRPLQNPHVSPDPHPSPPSCLEDHLRRSRSVRTVRVGFQASGRGRPHRSRRPGPRWPLTRLHHPGGECQAAPSSPAGVSSPERTTRAPSGPWSRSAQDLLKVKPGLSKSKPGARISNPVCTKSQFPTLSQIHGRLAAPGSCCYTWRRRP